MELVSGIKQLKSYFFVNTKVGYKRGSRFREDDRPNEQTFRDLIESVPFKKEVSDQAQLDSSSGSLEEKAGLVVLATGNQIKAFTNPTGRSAVATPENMTELADASQTVSIVAYGGTSDFTGAVIDTGLDSGTTVRNKYLPTLATGFIDALNTALTSILNRINTVSNNLSGYIISNDAALVSLDSRVSVLEAASAGFSLPIGGTYQSIVLTADGKYTSGGQEYMSADGRAISRTTYSTLFAMVGTAYGIGDGTTTFNIPNFQNSFLRNGSLTPVGLEGYASAAGGADSVTLNSNHLPQHQHSMLAANGATVAVSGGSHSHNVARPVKVDPTSGSNGGYQYKTDCASTDIFVTNTNTHTHPASEFSGNTGNNSTTATAVPTIPAYKQIVTYIRVK